MKTIKHLIGWIMTLCIVNSCGLDKLNNVVEYEFYSRNEIGEGFSHTDMDLFNHALIGDLREDTYAEAEMTEDGRKIRWSPHEINEKSFYSPDSWIFE